MQKERIDIFSFYVSSTGFGLIEARVQQSIVMLIIIVYSFYNRFF